MFKSLTQAAMLGHLPALESDGKPLRLNAHSEETVMRAELIFSVILVALAGVVTAASGQTDGHLRIHVVAANDPDSAIQITGFRTDKHPNNGPAALLTNVSRKIVTEVTLATAEAIPNGCKEILEPSLYPAFGNGGLHAETLYLAPKQSAVSVEHYLPPGLLAMHAKEANTKFLHVQIGVVHIQFSDGTSWQRDQAENVLSPRLLMADLEPCRRSNSQKVSLEHVNEFKLSPRFGSYNVDPDSLGYSFACTVAEDKAFCPSWKYTPMSK